MDDHRSSFLFDLQSREKLISCLDLTGIHRTGFCINIDLLYCQLCTSVIRFVPKTAPSQSKQLTPFCSHSTSIQLKFHELNNQSTAGKRLTCDPRQGAGLGNSCDQIQIQRVFTIFLKVAVSYRCVVCLYPRIP